jgi:hypothetical protein
MDIASLGQVSFRVLLEKLIAAQLVKNFPIFWNLEVHYHVQNSLLLVTVLRQDESGTHIHILCL